jgi:hypothetical protein
MNKQEVCEANGARECQTCLSLYPKEFCSLSSVKSQDYKAKRPARFLTGRFGSYGRTVG